MTDVNFHDPERVRLLTAFIVHTAFGGKLHLQGMRLKIEAYC